MEVVQREIAFIDHYDSFSYNVIDWLLAADPQLNIRRICFDNAEEMLNLLQSPRALVISPGPKRPEDATPTLELVKSLWGRVPILGICLGHQILGRVTGAKIAPLSQPIHGLTKKVQIHSKKGLFADFPDFAEFGVYNSLTIEPGSLQNSAKILASCINGEIQAVQYLESPPTIGLQFHPESFLSQMGPELAKNWLKIVMLPCKQA